MGVCEVGKNFLGGENVCKSRRHAVLLASYLIGLGIAVLSLKLAVSIGIVAVVLWMFNFDEVSYQLKMKRGN